MAHENQEKEHPGKEKNKSSLTIRHGGHVVELEFNIHQKIKKLLEEALKEFKERYGLQPPANEVPYLRYGNENLSDLDKSIQDYGIPDKAVLDLLFEHRGG